MTQDFKVTTFDSTYSQRLASGDTILGGSSGSNTSLGTGDFELKNEGGQDYIQAHGSMGSTETFDPTDGNVHTGTLNANCTFTLNAPSGTGACSLEFWLTQDGTGGWAVTWPGSVTVIGTPDTTLSTTSRVIVETIDGGTSWIATWVGGTSSGGFPPATWFDVTDHGAVHDGTTDDTTAIQAAITACMAAGGGIVYFPKGIYAVKGALQDTSVRNAQLVIPQNAVSGSAPPVVIEFRGEGPQGQWNHGTSGAWVPGTATGSILLSNWNGTISGHPAVIAAADWDSQYGGTHSSSFNWIEVILRDLEVRTHANPKLSAFELGGTASVQAVNLTLSTDTDSASMVKPTNGNSVGIRGPLQSNSNPPYSFENVFVDGYYTGLVLAEVAKLGDLAVHHCTVGIEFVGPQNHAISAERILFVACATPISISGGTFFLNIANLQIEHSIGSGTFQRTNDINDPSNYGKGFIVYHTVQAGVGPDDSLLVNGGSHLTLISLDSGSLGGGASFATPAIVLGTAAAAGAASTTIRSDSTIVAFDATAPTTSAIGDAAATGSQAKAARRDHVHGREALSTATPLVESGAGAVGTGVKSSREDHVHPAAASSGTGTSDHEHIANVVFSGDGSTTAWELPAAPADSTSIAVYVTGSRSIAWVLSGALLTTLTFDSAPASAANNIVIDIVAATA